MKIWPYDIVKMLRSLRVGSEDFEDEIKELEQYIDRPIKTGAKKSVEQAKRKMRKVLWQEGVGGKGRGQGDNQYLHQYICYVKIDKKLRAMTDPWDEELDRKRREARIAKCLGDRRI